MNVQSEKVEPQFVPRVPRHIDLADLRSVNFWARRFRISHGQLRRAVKQVGPDVVDVARYLGQSVAVTQQNELMAVRNPPTTG